MTHLRPVHAEEELLTRDQLAELWHTSADTIDRMREKGMPCIRWGSRFLRFRASECVAWLESQGEEAA